jgi:two-component system response regulator HydG
LDGHVPPQERGNLVLLIRPAARRHLRYLSLIQAMNAHREPSILVVDDERDIRENLRDILTDMGYTVDVAADGPEALAMVQARHYDVALLDLRMPGMDGLELYRRIKEVRACTVAIIVTAYASAETARDALQAGAWRIISKPVEIQSVLGLIGEALDQPVVLLIDDDVDLCRSMWDVLRDQGYRVCLAHDANQATAELANQRFQIVLIDMKLPQGDGAEVFHRVRQANPDTRTVLITGFRGELECKLNEIIDAGADAVCFKPFDVEQLLQTVAQLAPGPGNR